MKTLLDHNQSSIYISSGAGFDLNDKNVVHDVRLRISRNKSTVFKWRTVKRWAHYPLSFGHRTGTRRFLSYQKEYPPQLSFPLQISQIRTSESICNNTGFMWLFTHDACLTHCNLQRRGMMLCSRCFISNSEVESSITYIFCIAQLPTRYGHFSMAYSGIYFSCHTQLKSYSTARLTRESDH